jgi:hypothetical protein
MVFIFCEDFLIFCPGGYFLCRFFYFVRALKRCARARQIAYRTLYAACFVSVVSMTVFSDDPVLPGRDAAMFRLLSNGKPDAGQALAWNRKVKNEYRDVVRTVEDVTASVHVQKI